MAVTIIYPEVHNLLLKGRVPSKKNSKRRIRRGNATYMVPSEAHEAWHEEQMIALRYQWPSKLTITKAQSVEIIFYPPDRRKADLSNKAESVMDLLVDAGILADDSWFVVPTLTLIRAEVSPKDPRAIIKITMEL
jgi:Holliday junction resolvase RusA-like endonuclease